jgi:dTDP-4-amino-4,6-dideoxygalactose transaminase
MSRVPFLSPTFPPVEEVAADYVEIVRSGIFSNGGPFERRFAAELARWIGGGVAVSLVCSGTAGLALAVGDTFHRGRRHALVASFTFAAGPLVLAEAGFAPVFLDIDPGDWHPSLAAAEAFLGAHAPDTAGILLTATFGVANARTADWEALAARHGLPLVIDAAAGMGAEYEPGGERLGARGTCEVFSLHATKTLAVGEGGAVSARDHGLIGRLDRAKNFGFDERREVAVAGANAKLSELPCAIGLRQLAALATRVAARRRVLERYREGLAPLGVAFQPLADCSAVPFVSALVPTASMRDDVLATLAAADVEARAYYNPPVHRHPVFREAALAGGALPVTEDFSARIVSLPTSSELADADVERVIALCAPVLAR